LETIRSSAVTLIEACTLPSYYPSISTMTREGGKSEAFMGYTGDPVT